MRASVLCFRFIVIIPGAIRTVYEAVRVYWREMFGLGIYTTMMG